MALATVKVQNWDKTITTIPTHKLTSESFKNWRGMREAGCRRIKRSINLDISSIRFLTDGEIDRYEHSEPLIGSADGPTEWLRLGRGSQTFTGRRDSELSAPYQRRRVSQLSPHPPEAPPDIMNEMPLVVRQLPPERHGLPLEIYVFSRETSWEKYESIQGNIISSALAVLPQFDLRAFQEPTDSFVRPLDQVSR